ncbi:MAG TPA: hypothetical protein DD635_09545 [Flavobacteriales bacterium]|nr:hypothetical protein [Flavobacteriales bacterium]|tara:strand:- start:647 stop:1123 length:477 start_codon:yes stop_codon:yes gene_type:complete
MKINWKFDRTMKTGETFGYFATMCAVLLMSCSGGADSAGTMDETAGLNACECLIEMNSALKLVLGDENNDSWSAKQWTEELAKTTSSCMTAARTPQELSAWSKEQSTCPGYSVYTELVGSFRAKMISAKGEGTDMPKNIKDISEEGAKGLLDELSKQR